MIIDSHTHVFQRPVISYPRREDGTTFMSIEDQIALMDSLGIEKAVVLPLNNAEAPAEPQSVGELLEIRDRYPGRFVPYCNIDPRLPRAPEAVTTEEFVDLLGQYRDVGCRGLGELTARMPWYHPSLQAMMAACAEVRFPVVFHTIPADVNSYGVLDEIGLPGLEYTLTRHPELILVGHSPGFWSEISGAVSAEEKRGYPQGPVSPGGTVIRLMRRHPNLYADLSAGSGFTALARDESFALEFIDEFADRLFFGLDCNRPGCNTGLLSWLTDRHEDGRISDADFEAIMAGNIARVLGIDIPGAAGAAATAGPGDAAGSGSVPGFGETAGRGQTWGRGERSGPGGTAGLGGDER